jgi:DnaJ like chaperone protein
MGWYGKILGAVLGAIIGRGLLGALVGFLIGHQYDRRTASNGPRVGGPSQELQRVFFRATFQMMGHVAKSDGRVTESEIDAARDAMRRFSLSAADVDRAIGFFTEGKRPDFPLDAILAELRGLTEGRPDLRRLFLQIQLEAAIRGDGLNTASRPVFVRMCGALGVSSIEFAALEAMLRMHGASRPGGRPGKPAADLLGDAYRVLSVDPGASDAAVTLAYRRLVSQNHPDKLVANGLPESMIEAAHERTRSILEAYEVIKRHRGMK